MQWLTFGSKMLDFHNFYHCFARTNDCCCNQIYLLSKLEVKVNTKRLERWAVSHQVIQKVLGWRRFRFGLKWTWAPFDFTYHYINWSEFYPFIWCVLNVGIFTNFFLFQWKWLAKLRSHYIRITACGEIFEIIRFHVLIGLYGLLFRGKLLGNFLSLSTRKCNSGFFVSKIMYVDFKFFLLGTAKL